MARGPFETSCSCCGPKIKVIDLGIQLSFSLKFSVKFICCVYISESIHLKPLMWLVLQDHRLQMDTDLLASFCCCSRPNVIYT